jgi:hypothetical protein
MWPEFFADSLARNWQDATVKLEELIDLGPKLRASEIGAFEKLIASTLPEDYRHFLLRTNGGEPNDEQGWFKMKTRAPRKWSRVRFFFGLRRNDTELWLLEPAWREFHNRVDAHTIPIATDVYGNLILLVVNGGKRNQVYFWSHEWDEPDIKLASSFSEFLESIQTDPDSVRPG